MGNWKITMVIAVSVLLLFSVITPESMAASGSVKGWIKAGPDIDGYSIGTEESDHGVIAYIQSENPKPLKYGVLMQRFTSDKYKGKRLRLSAKVKSSNVALFSGMWLRVDLDKEIVAFDNMMNRPITGTTDWQACSIVLDVPLNSDLVMMGLALQGEGKVYWRDLNFEIVGDDVPVTGFYDIPSDKKSTNRSSEKKPANLDFEQ